jgi:hypothetical protein
MPCQKRRGGLVLRTPGISERSGRKLPLAAVRRVMWVYGYSSPFLGMCGLPRPWR